MAHQYRRSSVGLALLLSSQRAVFQVQVEVGGEEGDPNEDVEDGEELQGVCCRCHVTEPDSGDGHPTEVEGVDPALPSKCGGIDLVDVLVPGACWLALIGHLTPPSESVAHPSVPVLVCASFGFNAPAIAMTARAMRAPTKVARRRSQPASKASAWTSRCPKMSIEVKKVANRV